MTRSLFALLAALLAASFGPSPAAAATQWVMGYYVGYQRDMLPPSAIAWNGLSHIVMGRILARPDGTIDTSFDWDPVNGPILAKDVSTRAHAAGRKAILMLGGAGEGTKIRQAVTGHRAAFVANLVATMKDLGYDGIDLDWEDDIDWPAFVAFATDLRKAAPKAILTMPVGVLNMNYDTVDPRLPAIAAKLDRLSVMSYYPATSWAGSGWLSWFNSPLDGEKPATPASIASSLEAYAAAGIPKAKLSMGISFYAICYTGGVTGPNQSTENGVAIAGGDNDFELSELYGRNGIYAEANRRWYAAASEPYLTLPKPDSRGCRYVSYEDEQSILAKGAYSRSKGYGGIIIWTINQGNVVSHPRRAFLMDALEKGFLRPGVARTVAVSVIQGDTWIKPKAKLRFAALVTGTASRGVTWSVAGTGCGTIDAGGTYTAPATARTCTVKATSKADPTRSATAKVTVSNAAWTVGFSISRSGTWWVEVIAKNAAVVSMAVRWPDGTVKPLALQYRRPGDNWPVFAANYGFPDAGGKYVFEARAANNRLATATLTVPACDHGDDGVCR